jgi:uncharacterized SAM-binding protein YcdF (DUF218 family)
VKAALPGAVVLLTSGLWLAWPWIVPLVSPVPTSGPGGDLVVVLDGGSGRFAAADRIGHGLSKPPRRLLIRCPRSTPPAQPTPELLQGFDTATQITALAHWLRRQPSPRSARVWIATDPDHTARAVVLTRIALGSQGIRVGPADLPSPSPSEHRKFGMLCASLFGAPLGALALGWRPRLLPANGRIVGCRGCRPAAS